MRSPRSVASLRSANGAHERQDPRRKVDQRRQHRVAGIFVEPQAAEPRVMMVDEHIQFGGELARFREIADPQPATPDLVLVGRPDPAQRGCRSARGADAPEPGRSRGGSAAPALRSRQSTGYPASPAARLDHPPDFREQRFRIERHAVADHAALAARHRSAAARACTSCRPRPACDPRCGHRCACNEIGLCRQPVHDAPPSSPHWAPRPPRSACSALHVRNSDNRSAQPDVCVPYWRSLSTRSND